MRSPVDGRRLPGKNETAGPDGPAVFDACTEPVLDRVADRAEDRADLAAEEDQGDDRDDRDEGEDQRVFGETLAFLVTIDEKIMTRR